jgi:hypothetical protein
VAWESDPVIAWSSGQSQSMDMPSIFTFVALLESWKGNRCSPASSLAPPGALRSARSTYEAALAAGPAASANRIADLVSRWATDADYASSNA